jgi:hypothetical protein
VVRRESGTDGRRRSTLRLDVSRAGAAGQQQAGGSGRGAEAWSVVRECEAAEVR